MRAIQKGPEPQSLAQHRATRTANYRPTYESFQHKDQLRQSLCAEQGSICCYCMQRIRPTDKGMKIEHWHCQQDHEDEQLDYSNLLGACLGGQGKPLGLQHCDTHKGHLPLSRNPANVQHQVETYIRFTNGIIESTDSLLDNELNEVLNLNLPELQRNRKAVLDGFLQSLPKKKGAFTKERLERWISDWNGDNEGRRRPYCHVVVYWLRKKLARTRK